MQNKAVFYFHFDVFIFDNKVARGKMQLDGTFFFMPEIEDKNNKVLCTGKSDNILSNAN
jgi:hypothetical protein